MMSTGGLTQPEWSPCTCVTFVILQVSQYLIFTAVNHKKPKYLSLFQDDPSQDIYYAYNNIIINGVGTQGFEHHQSYILEKLVPDSMYEAQIQARNHYGWSAVSEKFQFYTRAYGEFDLHLG